MKKKQCIDKYQVIDRIGSGGNAVVHKVKSPDGQEYALKQLHKQARRDLRQPKNKEMQIRFIDEITTIYENHESIEGIIPIVDYSKEDFWYTMPIAKSIVEHIKISSESPNEIVIGIIQISDTLSALHDKELSHRDIKPSNIYFYNNRYYIGDFGLVDLPDNDNNLTRSDRGLGAIFTIAPEMKRDPKNADGKKADVYSLAKTLWMLLTLDETGFEGTYDFFDLKHSLREFTNLNKYHLVELEELLQDATNNTPELRPSMKEFKQRLCEWLKISSNHIDSQKSEWVFLNKHILKSNGDSVSWRDREEIVYILNKVGSLPAHNHMLFSTGGGQDFVKSSIAPEDGCIYISDYCTPYHIVKPKVLHFERFKNNEEWNYLLLECEELPPIKNDDIDYEILVEDYPANYVSAQYEQYGVYDYEDGNPLPADHKVVSRYIRGKFLFVLKSGPYNGISSTYDGRHGQYTSEQFREYISQLILAKHEHTKEHFKNEPNTLLDNIDNQIDETTDIQDSIADIISAEKYVKDHYTEWIFDDSIYEKSESSGAFYISFHINDGSFNIFEHLYLCNDGHIYSKEVNDLKDVKLIYSRSEAYESAQKCKCILEKECAKNGLNMISAYFSVNIIKNNKPNHLFTKEEIRNLMLKADDRASNTLVIDENGYAKIVQGRVTRHSYPVTHESWDAGNVYVGKYSSLSTLDDNYLTSLQGWLFYLQNGKSVYIDHPYEECDEKLLLDKIQEYY